MPLRDRLKKQPAASATSPCAVRNPLIDDLIDELGECSVSHMTESNVRPLSGYTGRRTSLLQGASFTSVNSIPRRDSEAPSYTSASGRTNAYRIAADAVTAASNMFVHTMKMHGMETYFVADPNARKEEQLESILVDKPRVELSSLVATLVEILEDVRLARGQMIQHTESYSFGEGSISTHRRSCSMCSTVSIASLWRPPVQETQHVAKTYDLKGNRMINRYVVLANLGQGAYGKVKLGQETDTGKKVAIKIIDKKMLSRKLGTIGSPGVSALNREIAIMKKVRHRNCVSLYEVIEDVESQKLYLIMDYVPNGPVVRLKEQKWLPSFLHAVEADNPVEQIAYNTYLVRTAVRFSQQSAALPLTAAEIDGGASCHCCKPLRQATCAMFLRQLVSGLRYLHKRNVVHHDIKPDNILLGNDNCVFFTDFGVSEILSGGGGASGSSEDGKSNENESREKTKPVALQSPTPLGLRRNKKQSVAPARFGAGTLLFTAPELFDATSDGEPPDPFLTDVWALGVTVYCMLVGCVPFSGAYYRQVVDNTKELPYPWNGKNLHNQALLPEWKTILDGLLAKKPEQRWNLLRLKNYLDSADFQQALSTLTASAASGESSPSFASGGRPCSRSGKATSAAMPSYSTPTTSVLSNGKGGGPLAAIATPPADRYWDVAVSPRDLELATRREKVEVVEHTAEVSEHTRAIIHTYTQHVRQRLSGRYAFFAAGTDNQLHTEENTGTSVGDGEGGGTRAVGYTASRREPSAMTELLRERSVVASTVAYHGTCSVPDGPPGEGESPGVMWITNVDSGSSYCSNSSTMSSTFALSSNHLGGGKASNVTRRQHSVMTHTVSTASTRTQTRPPSTYVCTDDGESDVCGAGAGGGGGGAPRRTPRSRCASYHDRSSAADQSAPPFLPSMQALSSPSPYSPLQKGGALAAAAGDGGHRPQVAEDGAWSGAAANDFGGAVTFPRVAARRVRRSEQRTLSSHPTQQQQQHQQQARPQPPVPVMTAFEEVPDKRRR